jgi:CRP-like cAMP-binding protein
LMACAFYMFSYKSASSDDQMYDSWIDRKFRGTDTSVSDLYIQSYYWILQTLTTVGYGDGMLNLANEQLFAVMIMLIGVVFFSLTISHLSRVIANSDSNQIALDSKLRILGEIQKDYGINQKLYKNIRITLEKNKIELGNDTSVYKDFLADLPTPIQTDLSYTMHKDLIQNLLFFQDSRFVDNEEKTKFIAKIGPHLTSRNCTKDDVIYSVNMPPNFMYFIMSGSVALVLPEFDDFDFIKISAGYHFGDIELIYDERRRFTIMAMEDTKILNLPRTIFQQVFFHDFPLLGSKLFKEARKRLSRQIRASEFAVMFCNEKRKKLHHLSATELVGRTSKFIGTGEKRTSELNILTNDKAASL